MAIKYVAIAHGSRAFARIERWSNLTTPPGAGSRGTTSRQSTARPELEYGEGVADDWLRNPRGQLHAHHDLRKLSTVAAYDFTGKPTAVTRPFESAYKAPRLGWQTANLAAKTFAPCVGTFRDSEP
jgi:hypothetical protein